MDVKDPVLLFTIIALCITSKISPKTTYTKYIHNMKIKKNTNIIRKGYNYLNH